MSNPEEDGLGVDGLLHCPQCHTECVDARALFRHVETVFVGQQSSCLESMGFQMEEFRADYRKRRRKVAYRNRVLPEVDNLLSCCFSKNIGISTGWSKRSSHTALEQREVWCVVPLLLLPDAEVQEQS